MVSHITPANPDQPEQNVQPKSGKRKQLGKALWAIRRLVVLSALAAFVLVVILIAATRTALPTIQVSNTAIGFLFSGAEKNTYPNSSPFSILDVTAPVVLRKTYDENQLSNLDISLKDFITAISIRPYAPTYTKVFERYNERLRDRRLSFSERKEIEKEMVEELAQQQGRNALLSLTTTGQFAMPQPLAEKVLSDIAKNWAEHSIVELGVLRHPETPDKSQLLDPETMKSLDLASAVFRLREANDRLDSKILALKELPGSETLIGEENGINIETLQRRIKDFGQYNLELLLWDALRTSDRSQIERLQVIIQRKVDDLTAQFKQAEDKANSLQKRLAEYAQLGQLDTQPAAPGLPPNSDSTAATISQFGEGTIDKIIQLARQESDKGFRQGLVNAQLKFRNRAIDISARLANLEAILNKASAQTDGQQGFTSGSVSSTELRQRALAATNSINENWRVATLFFEKINSENLSLSGKLYQPLELATSEQFRSYHPVINATTWLLAGLAALIAALIALLVGLGRQIQQGRLSLMDD